MSVFGRLVGGVVVGGGLSALYIHSKYVVFEDMQKDALQHIQRPTLGNKHPRSLAGYPITLYTEGTLREPAPAPKPLTEHVQNPVDVCIIGGGLAGLHCALALSEKGKSVTVLEAGRVGCRASGRNGGDAIIGFHTEVDELARIAGDDNAKQIYGHSVVEGYERLKGLIQKYKIQCGSKEEGAVTVTFSKRIAATGKPIESLLHEEREYAATTKQKFGEELEVWDKRTLEKNGIHSDRYAYGIFNPKNITLNPLELVLGLARACRSNKCSIYEASPVTSCTKLPKRKRVADSSNGSSTAPLSQDDDDLWLVTTELGSVLAKHVVLATNGAPAHISPKLALATSSLVTAMMLTKPIDKHELDKVLTAKCAVFDERFALAYYRRVDGNRIMFGTLAKGMPMSKQYAEKALITDISKTFPSLAPLIEVDVSWQGRLHAKLPVFPMIGRDPSSGMWYSLGYSGHGLVPTCAGGELVASAIVSLDERKDGSRAKPDERYKLWGLINHGPAAHNVPSFLPPSFLPIGGPWGLIGSVLFCKYAELKDSMEKKD